MFDKINLRALADQSGPERAFLSLYLAGPDALRTLDRRIDTVRRLLSENETEREYFEENLKQVEDFLDGYSFDGNALCLFTCWATDYQQAFPLEKEVPNMLWVDSSPYIRPLAELQDEYENFVVVAADNTSTRIYLVTSAVAREAASVRGDIKNDVKKGGWSQKRYERRRDEELQHYAKDVVAKLQALNREAGFRRLILLGSQEALTAIEEALPEPLAEKVAGEEKANLQDDKALWKEAFGMFFEEERASEEVLWEKIKSAYMQGEQAAVGPKDVLEAAGVGRVEHMIVTRDAKVAGIRCRDCENLSAGNLDQCPVCGSDDVFTEDLINELVELLAQSSAETEFSDPIAGLSEVGDVAALLRY